MFRVPDVRIFFFFFVICYACKSEYNIRLLINTIKINTFYFRSLSVSAVIRIQVQRPDVRQTVLSFTRDVVFSRNVASTLMIFLSRAGSITREDDHEEEEEKEEDSNDDESVVVSLLAHGYSHSCAYER